MEDAADAVPWSKPTIDAHWQSQVDAIGSLLFNRRAVHLDEFRRYIEALPDASAKAMTYYGKWAAALLQCLLRNGTITEVEVDALLNGRDNVTASPCFAMGDHVRVRPYVATGLSLVRKPHLRTPGYLFGARGVVVGLLGSLQGWNPNAAQALPVELGTERAAAPTGAAGIPHSTVAPQPQYRVRFRMGDLWQHAEDAADEVDVEIFQEWLEHARDTPPPTSSAAHSHSHDHGGHSHSHEHDHAGESHTHTDRTETERVALGREGVVSLEEQRLAETLLKLVVGKGLLKEADILERERLRDSFGTDPLGPKLVVRAWRDAEFRARLLADGTATCKEYGVDTGCVFVVHANDATTHNVIVCTLCSCYPVAVLGRPPPYYKSAAFRGRVPREPRAVLREMGTELAPGVQLRVHDSTSEMRYMVLPQRPEGTDDWTDEQLLALLNRDVLVGVTLCNRK